MNPKDWHTLTSNFFSNKLTTSLGRTVPALHISYFSAFPIHSPSHRRHVLNLQLPQCPGNAVTLLGRRLGVDFKARDMQEHKNGCCVLLVPRHRGIGLCLLRCTTVIHQSYALHFFNHTTLPQHIPGDVVDLDSDIRFGGLRPMSESPFPYILGMSMEPSC